MRRPFLIILLILLISIPLAFILHGFTREIFLSLVVRLAWFTRLYIESLPQPILWAIFIVITIVIASRSLLRRRTRDEVTSEGAKYHMGRVHNLMQAINRTSDGLYFKWRLSQHILGLTTEALSYRERISPDQVRARLKSGELDLPPETEAYLKAGLTPAFTQRSNLLARLKEAILPTHRTDALDLDPENVIQFLEDLLEIDYE